MHLLENSPLNGKCCNTFNNHMHLEIFVSFLGASFQKDLIWLLYLSLKAFQTRQNNFYHHYLCRLLLLPYKLCLVLEHNCNSKRGFKTFWLRNVTTAAKFILLLLASLTIFLLNILEKDWDLGIYFFNSLENFFWIFVLTLYPFYKALLIEHLWEVIISPNIYYIVLYYMIFHILHYITLYYILHILCYIYDIIYHITLYYFTLLTQLGTLLFTGPYGKFNMDFSGKEYH